MSQYRNFRHTSNNNRSSRRRLKGSKQRHSRARFLPPINSIGANHLMGFEVRTLRAKRRSRSQVTRLSPRRGRRRRQGHTVETTRPIVLRQSRTRLSRRHIRHTVFQARSPTRSSNHSDGQRRLQRMRRNSRRKDHLTTRFLLGGIDRR